MKSSNQAVLKIVLECTLLVSALIATLIGIALSAHHGDGLFCLAFGIIAVQEVRNLISTLKSSNGGQ